jgi:DNA processing protein
MPLHSDIGAWLRVSLIPGVGSRTFTRLLQEFGEPQSILNASLHALTAVVNAPIAAAIKSGGASINDCDSAELWLSQNGNHIVTLADAHYPQSLLETHDPPPLLYVKGRLDLLNHASIAIVGSRNPTAQGVSNAEAFASSLGLAGFSIVSGLAHGIDAAAHRGGLKNIYSTIAVVGTGLDIVYPSGNRDLAHQIATTGCLISEFPLGTSPLPAHFPRRNRLICGLSKGCLVVEAALSSGSLITARYALEQGREVFAIPGSIHSPVSKGCHTLIKQGAKLVESAQDVLDELGWTHGVFNNEPSRLSEQTEHPLFAFLGYDPIDLDTLQQRCQWPVHDLNIAITELELAGLLSALPGGQLQRIV